jgi:transglutaminase-like putative cysteine protease
VRKLQIEHRTEYRFASAVSFLPHRMLLRPRESHGLRIASSTLEISPAHTVRWQRDALDNSVAVASFSAPATSLLIASQLIIEHYDEAPLDFLVEDYATTYPFAYQAEDASVLEPLRAMAWPNDRALVDKWVRGLGLGSGKIVPPIALALACLWVGGWRHSTGSPTRLLRDVTRSCVGPRRRHRRACDSNAQPVILDG